MFGRISQPDPSATKPTSIRVLQQLLSSNPYASNVALQALLQYADRARSAVLGMQSSLPLLDRNAVTVLLCCGLQRKGALHVERWLLSYQQDP